MPCRVRQHVALKYWYLTTSYMASHAMHSFIPFFCIHIVLLHLFYFLLYTAEVMNFTEDTLRIIPPVRIHVMKTNLMHYLSSVYFVSQPLHVLGIFVANHQEIYYMYI